MSRSDWLKGRWMETWKSKSFYSDVCQFLATSLFLFIIRRDFMPVLLQNGGYKTNINVKISAIVRSISAWCVCVFVFQNWKWPGWAQMETWQTWHSLSQNYMETPSSCQPALSNNTAEMVGVRCDIVFLHRAHIRCCSVSSVMAAQVTECLSLLLVCLHAGEIRMAFVLYRNLGLYLSTENASVRLGSDAVYPNYSVIVNSPVITASINKESNKVYLSEPVVFTVKHLQVRDTLSVLRPIKKNKCLDLLCLWVAFRGVSHCSTVIM